MSTVEAEQAAVTGAELASFTRQLGAMLHAGVNVLRALRIASQYSGSGPLIEASRDVAKALEDGKELHQAIGRHPELFDPFYVEMVRQGEADGTLGQTLLGVADYLDHLTLPPTLPAEHAAASSTAYTPSTGASRSLLNTLGVLALGAAVIGVAVASGLLEGRWYLPFISGWAAYCFLSASRQPGPSPAPQIPVPTKLPPLPRKSAQRRAAETDGMVRSALQEQDEAEESQAIPKSGSTPVSPELLLPPDERVPPRFEL